MKTAHTLEPKIIALFLILACCINCEEKTKQDPDDDHGEPPVIERPENIISLNEAEAIYMNYSENRVEIIETYEKEKRAPGEPFEASRFVDFDYKTIKQYIDYVDQEAAKAGIKEVTKLRLYFANYPNKAEFSNNKKVVHPRQNSVFIVPTLDKGGDNYGFYINPNSGKANLISDRKMSNEKGMGSIDREQKAFAGFSTSPSVQDDGSLTLNFGTGGPPPKTDFN